MKKYFFAILSLMLTALPARAISFENPGSSLGLGTADLKNTTLNIVNWALGLLGIVAIVVFIFFVAGNAVTSGDSEPVHTRIRRAAIGLVISLVIILLAWAIVNYVIGTTSNVSGVS